MQVDKFYKSKNIKVANIEITNFPDKKDLFYFLSNNLGNN